MKVSLQPAFVLHSRPFRDSSVIVEVFSRDYGRVGLLAKGQRQANNRKRFALEPFTPLLLSWQGRGELKFITVAEVAGHSALLSGERLYCALYCNEILMRLLPPFDAHAQLYDAYWELLQQLATTEQLEPQLRQFEITLLGQLGYGIDFSDEADSGEAISSDGDYLFVADFGFTRVTESEIETVPTFKGEQLLAIAESDYKNAETRRAAKRIMRLALEPHLGDKPLNSRKLFRH